MVKARSTVLVALIAAACIAVTASSTFASSAAKYKVVYIPGLTGNPFYSTVACGAQSVAAKLNVDFSVQGAPTFAVNAQTPVVNAVVASHPNAIMISNDDPKAMIPPLQKAQAAGIKIVNIDGDLAKKSVGVTNIQSNNLLGGKLAGQEMGKLLKGKGAVQIIDNDPGFPIAEQRVKGFENAIKKFKGITNLGVQYSHNVTANAASIVKDAAVAHSDLAGVYTVETNNTQGAITGVQQAHLTGKVKIIGYDTSDPIVAGIKKGIVSADIVQYPYGEGRLGLKSAVMAIQGKHVPREQTQPFVIATPKNINTAKVQRFIYKTTCSG
jgi:ribose transport system substrate-binding protein